MANFSCLCNPLPWMLAIQWVLMEASLLSLSCLTHALLLAVCRCPYPSLDALPRIQEETALAVARLISLLNWSWDWAWQYNLIIIWYVWKKNWEKRKVFFLSIQFLLRPRESILDWFEDEFTVQNEDGKDQQALPCRQDHTEREHHLVSYLAVRVTWQTLLFSILTYHIILE